jgi:hypothetical protein
MEAQTETVKVNPSAAAIIRALQEKAELQGVSLDELLLSVFEPPNGKIPPEALLDWDYIAECAAEADPSITLTEVREALSKIPGPVAADVSRERDER